MPPKRTLLVVGYGNMAKAILTQNTYIFEHYQVFISGRHSHKIRSFIQECGLEKNVEILSVEKGQMDINGKDILLCVKPRGLESFNFMGKANCVYSVLAGINVSNICSKIKAQTYIRLMPNIAAYAKKSATAVYVQPQDSQDLSIIQAFIESFGNAVMVENESLIDASIATSGSSIAFLALVAESLIDAGIYEGLTYTQSMALVKQTFAGFAQVLEDKTPNELKYAISSPAGTTIAGLAILEQEGVSGAIMKAAHQAVERSLEIGKTLNVISKG